MAKATRTRGRRRRARPEARGPLGLTASRVHALAVRVREHQDTAEHLAALQQRRDQLEALATRLRVLVVAAHVLETAGASIPTAPGLRRARQTALELKERYERDPRSVRRAQPASLGSPLQPMEDALRRGWRELAGPQPGAVALAG